MSSDVRQILEHVVDDEQTALTVVWTLSKLVEADAANARSLVSQNGITSLSALGLQWGGDVAYLACKVICIAMDAESFDEFGADGMRPGIPLIVARLEDERDDVWGLSVMTIAKIASHPQLLSDLICSGAVGKLLQVVDTCTDIRMLKYISSTILKFAMQSMQARTQLADGATSLVTLCVAKLDDIVNYYASMSLLYIGLDSETNRKALCRAGAVLPLVQLHATPIDLELKQTIGIVLMQILMDHDCCNEAATAGAVTPAVSAVLCSDRVDLKQSAVFIIHYLSSAKEQQKHAANHVVTKLLLYALRDCHDQQVVEMALESLTNLSVSPHFCEVLVSPDIVQSLVQGQAIFEAPITYKLRFQTLGAIVKTSEYVQDMVIEEQGILERLLGACEHEHDEVVEQACIAIGRVLTDISIPDKISISRVAAFTACSSFPKLSTASSRGGPAKKAAEHALELIALANRSQTDFVFENPRNSALLLSN